MEKSLVGGTAKPDQVEDSRLVPQGKKRQVIGKTLAMYATMVVVSTCAIFLLEHATIMSAFRTALVAAIGKTFAANWVSSVFE